MIKNSFKLAFASVALAAMAACGGDPATQEIVSTNVVVTLAPANAAAVVNVPATFPAGVPALGTTASTVVTLPSATSFNIASGGQTATGVTTYGSCIFTVTASTFPASHPLALGKVVTVNPCALTVATAGLNANGAAGTASGTFNLGGTNSSPAPVTVIVQPGGATTVNGAPAGTAGTAQRTG